MDDRILLQRLRRDEVEALHLLREARERFDEILSGIPGGLPEGDGGLRIHQAGAEIRRLNGQSHQATKRLLDYLVRGVVPEGYPEEYPEEYNDAPESAGSGEVIPS